MIHQIHPLTLENEEPSNPCDLEMCPSESEEEGNDRQMRPRKKTRLSQPLASEDEELSNPCDPDFCLSKSEEDGGDSETESDCDNLDGAVSTSQLTNKAADVPPTHTDEPLSPHHTEDTNYSSNIYPLKEPTVTDWTFEDLPESATLRAEDNSQIFIRKIIAENVRSRNSRHACFFCEKLVHEIRKHIQRVHSQNPDVKPILKNSKQLDHIRKLGDDLHNRGVVQKGKGELLLNRRPKFSFNVADFGPCPCCREWYALSNLKRHVETCSGEKCRQSEVLIQSKRTDGRLNPASNTMRDIMVKLREGEVKTVIEEDPLIQELGHHWYDSLVSNKLQREKYARNYMRLVARLLLKLRSETGETSMTMSEFLTPSFFDSIVKCCIHLAQPDNEDFEEAKAPSNPIKLEFEIQRLLDIKWAMLVKKGAPQEALQEVTNLSKLFEKEYSRRVSRKAKNILTTRNLTVSQDVPNPETIEKLTLYLRGELERYNKEGDGGEWTFAKLAVLVQARLILFNKRRSFELDSISLHNYTHRQTGLKEIDKSLASDLTAMEQELLANQDIITVVGKNAQPVPVIIPSDAKKALDHLAGERNRKKASIPKANIFLFASTGQGPRSTYTALTKACTDAKVESSVKINSRTMRKYCATLTQMFNLQPHQKAWLLKHLGHTEAVHNSYYQQMSGLVEKVHLTKLLLIQDSNLTSKFKGKNLEEIPMEDIIRVSDQQRTTTPTTAATDESTDWHATTSTDRKSTFSSNEDSHRSQKGHHGKDMSQRRKWSDEEEAELLQFFETHFQNHTVPKKPEVNAARDRSFELEGSIWQREWRLIVQKISTENRKSKRKV
ncbi:uncharacterized protein [Littorina saxatilis]